MQKKITGTTTVVTIGAGGQYIAWMKTTDPGKHYLCTIRPNGTASIIGTQPVNALDGCSFKYEAGHWEIDGAPEFAFRSTLDLYDRMLSLLNQTAGGGKLPRLEEMPVETDPSAQR